MYTGVYKRQRMEAMEMADILPLVVSYVARDSGFMAGLLLKADLFAAMGV